MKEDGRYVKVWADHSSYCDCCGLCCGVIVACGPEGHKYYITRGDLSHDVDELMEELRFYAKKFSAEIDEEETEKALKELRECGNY